MHDSQCFFFNVSCILKIERFPFPIQCVLQWSFISFLYVCRYRINRLCCRVIGMNEKIETIKIINCILNYEFHLFLFLFGISVIGSTIIICVQFSSIVVISCCLIPIYLDIYSFNFISFVIGQNFWLSEKLARKWSEKK